MHPFHLRRLHRGGSLRSSPSFLPSPPSASSTPSSLGSACFSRLLSRSPWWHRCSPRPPLVSGVHGQRAQTQAKARSSASLTFHPSLADAPAFVDCPTESLITRAGSPLDGSQTLDSDEAAYISTRRSQVLTPLWENYLANDTGYNATAILAQEPKM